MITVLKEKKGRINLMENWNLKMVPQKKKLQIDQTDILELKDMTAEFDKTKANHKNRCKNFGTKNQHKNKIE